MRRIIFTLLLCVLPFHPCLSEPYLIQSLDAAVTKDVGTPPVAAIVGPEESLPGDLVVLRTDGSVGTDFKWAIVPETAAGRYLAVDGGKSVVFASRTPGSYAFILGVANEGEVALSVHTLLNREGPDPDPDPNPDPDPDPTPPGDLWGVVWVEESGERTAAQAAVILSANLEAYLKKEGLEFRVTDKDDTDESDEAPSGLSAYINLAKQSGDLPQVFVVKKDGRLAYKGADPETATAMIDLLNRLKGRKR